MQSMQTSRESLRSPGAGGSGGSGAGGAGGGATSGGRRGEPKRDIIKTWAFDSAGTKKYALQIQRASNGNPCLRIVEGTPQDDGGYRKFSLTFWSEDFEALFDTLSEVRRYMQENDIRTPDGHKWTPKKPPRGQSR